MFITNLPIVEEMFHDPKYQDFLLELARVFQGDPHYTERRARKILEGASRGERIIRFEDKYVISSFVPPVPSEAFLTFVKGGLDENNLFTDLAHVRRKAPLSAHLCITDRCNYNCEHCGATYCTDRPELTEQEWKTVIADMQDLGIANIVFSGGEPLMRDDMERIIEAVDERSSTLLFTNGQGLTKDRAASLKEAGLFILAVSLDSPYPEEHNSFRRNPKAFDHAIEAIHNAKDAGLYTLISSVIFRKDLSRKRLDDLFKLGLVHGVHEVRIHQPIPRGALSDTENPDDIFFKPEDIQFVTDVQFEVNQAAEGYPKVSSFPYTEGPHKFGCGAGVLHSYISSSGDLWPCDFIPLSFGNLVEEGVEPVYRRMMEIAGTPRTGCWAKVLSKKFNGQPLPRPPAESIEMCSDCESTTFPQFFADLQ